jgi:hypothetical protein
MNIVLGILKQQYVNFGAFLLLFVVIRLISFFLGFTDDINCWIQWSDWSRTQGLHNNYDSDTNYLPVYQYILWAFGKMAPSRNFIIEHIHFLTIITLLLELLGLWLVFKWNDKKLHSAL